MFVFADETVKKMLNIFTLKYLFISATLWSICLSSSTNGNLDVNSEVLELIFTHKERIESTKEDEGDPCSGVDDTQMPLCRIAERCVTDSSSQLIYGNLCHSTTTGNSSVQTAGRSKKSQPSSAAVWGYGILCVTVISLMSVMGVGVLPIMSKSFYKSFLTTMIGLAVGSLSGSALFHLIPSAFNLSEVRFFGHHSYLYISIVVWCGVYLFFVIERFLKVMLEVKNRRSASISKNSKELVNLEDQTEEKKLFQDSNNVPNGQRHQPEVAENAVDIDPNSDCIGFSNFESKELYEHSIQAMRASFGHMERPVADKRPKVDDVTKAMKTTNQSTIATVAWMIIFGDGVHNFIDGLSIGAAFSENILTGISVSIAVLCEELPHELGDFAVLLNSGMTMKQALFYNFLSACTCYLGLILGILLGEMDFGNEYIFALAGGMFLYISLVDMMPELNEISDIAAKISVSKSLEVFLLQTIGILAGIFSLFFLALYQDNIQIEF